MGAMKSVNGLMSKVGVVRQETGHGCCGVASVYIRTTPTSVLLAVTALQGIVAQQISFSLSCDHRPRDNIEEIIDLYWRRTDV